MKIRAYSDIHLNHFRYSGSSVLWYPPELPDDKDTVLVIAGDIDVGTPWTDLWITIVAPRFKQVLIVLGNHDYWCSSLTIKNGVHKCNDILKTKGINNVLVLDKSVFEVDDVMFIGCTLWTDMDKGDPIAMWNMPRVMSYDGKINYDKLDSGKCLKFSSDVWIQEHQHHKNFIEHVVKYNPERRIVVITHHVPLRDLIDPRFIGQASNAYYASDLSDLILDNPHIKLWISGHTHYTSDTIFGETRMVNNSVGYVGEHKEQQGLVQHNVIEI